MPMLHRAHRLIFKCRESGKCAHKADRDRLAPSRRKSEALIENRQYESDDEAARNIDDKRAEGEPRAHALENEQANRIARNRAQGSAESYPQIFHAPPTPFHMQNTRPNTCMDT